MIARELYDHQLDAGETENVAESDERNEVIQELETHLAEMIE